MLYLEDYLEMIEHLPSELRDRLTEMREMDLQVQNAMDSFDERVKVFFGNAKKLKPEQREAEYEKIRQDYYKALEDADEKVQLANQVYDLVDRYLRRLDQELSKFKMELEADNAGISEVLEKRSLELDNPPQPINHHRAEKRKYTQNALSNHLEKKSVTEKVLSSVAHEAARDVAAFQRSRSNSSSPAATMFNSITCAATTTTAAPTPALSYSLGQIGSSSNAIAAAASQAIAATQQMQQGRRTASLKASFEVMKNANADFRALIGDSLNGSSTTMSTTPTTAAVASSSERIESRAGRTKKNTTKAVTTIVHSESQASDDYSDSCIDENGQTLDWTYDPNEPRYCICNQVSYGDMVACDNEDCPFEWFHYACVGITQPPKGKWYCPQCTAAMKRRQRNK